MPAANTDDKDLKGKPGDKPDTVLDPVKAKDEKKGPEAKEDEKADEKKEEKGEDGPKYASTATDSGGFLQAGVGDNIPQGEKESFTTTIADEERAKKARGERGEYKPQFLLDGAKDEPDITTKK